MNTAGQFVAGGSMGRALIVSVGFAALACSQGASGAASDAGPPTITLLASTTSAPDDGTVITVLATVKDGSGAPIAGESVAFATTGGCALVNAVASTDATGVASTGVISLVAGPQTVTASIRDATATIALTFTPAPPSATRSDLRVSLAQVVLGEAIEASVQVRDTAGRPMAGRSVSLAHFGTATIVPPLGVTDASGAVKFTITASAPTKGALQAVVDPGAGAITLRDALVIEFYVAVELRVTVTGLTGPGLLLAIDGEQILVGAGSTGFTFRRPFRSGSTITVEIERQPLYEQCTVGEGTLTAGVVDLTEVVTCTLVCDPPRPIPIPAWRWPRPGTPCRGPWTATASGAGHSLALDASGTLCAWGRNDFGQLGVGSLDSSSRPVAMGSGVIAVAAGAQHSLAVTSDGLLWAWGDNSDSQLGDGGTTTSSTPVPVAAIGAGFVGVAAGTSHSLAVTASGGLWGWGSAWAGQFLPRADIGSRQATPICIAGGVASVAAGGSRTVVISSDGTLQAWGQVGNICPGPGGVVGGGFASASAGISHTLAVKTDGTLWAWGENWSGQLGDGSTQSSCSPVLVGSGFSSVSAGNSASYGVKPDGTLWAWGGTLLGNSRVPTPVASGFVSVSSAGHSLGVNSEGTLWAWGDNWFGQLGTGGTSAPKSSPVLVGVSFATVTASGDHALGTTLDGSLLAWGRNDAGQLGDGSTLDAHLPATVTSGIRSVSTGAAHTVAVGQDGTLWAWGSNTRGQLGDGTGREQLRPVAIGSGYTAAAAGRAHGVALSADGVLWGWGANDRGQLGIGTTPDQPVPVRIGGPFVFVAAGGDATYAIDAGGTLWGWGSLGGTGPLGTAAGGAASIRLGSGLARVATSGEHTAAVGLDGTLWTWGANTDGQLGDGTRTSTGTPIQIGTGFAAVATGAAHTLALKVDSTLHAWGRNGSGQIGIGSIWTTSYPCLHGDPVCYMVLSPRQIGAGFASIAAGASHSVAVKLDGTAWAWGSDLDGQLGSGGGQARVPVQVQ